MSKGNLIRGMVFDVNWNYPQTAQITQIGRIEEEQRKWAVFGVWWANGFLLEFSLCFGSN